jgi:putative DNA primase/helicase
MKGRRQWVAWKLELRNGKLTKISYTATAGKLASSTDLMTWSTFSEALKAYETGRYAGIGFVFCSADPYSGIDLDNCAIPRPANSLRMRATPE